MFVFPEARSLSHTSFQTENAVPPENPNLHVRIRHLRKYNVQLCQMFHYIVQLALKCNKRVSCFATHCFFGGNLHHCSCLARVTTCNSDIAELCHPFFSSLEKSLNNVIKLFLYPFFMSTRFLPYLKRSF